MPSCKSEAYSAFLTRTQKTRFPGGKHFWFYTTQTAQREGERPPSGNLELSHLAIARSKKAPQPLSQGHQQGGGVAAAAWKACLGWGEEREGGLRGGRESTRLAGQRPLQNLSAQQAGRVGPAPPAQPVVPAHRTHARLPRVRLRPQPRQQVAYVRRSPLQPLQPTFLIALNCLLPALRYSTCDGTMKQCMPATCKVWVRCCSCPPSTHPLGPRKYELTSQTCTSSSQPPAAPSP